MFFRGLQEAAVDAPGAVGQLHHRIESGDRLAVGPDDMDLLRDLADALSARLPDGVERLAGVELGAVPLVVATALVTGLPYVIVRKSAKEHGSSAGRDVEGNLEGGERVALIEDVVTTGTQAVRAAESLARAGVEVVTIIAVLDRREVSGASLGGFPFQALLRIEDLRVGNKD